MKTNIKAQKQPIFTAEGAKAQHITPELQLRRSVLSNLLWEKSFYIDGIDVAECIAKTIPLVEPNKVVNIAIEARERMKLRHVPLLIIREMARQPKHKAFVSTTLTRVIQRADELSEFVSLYWKDGKQPLSNQVKTGLANAFTKFNEYNLGKYNRDADVKLRDVLFLCHSKPQNSEQEILWKKLIDGKLEAPDTWEVALSAGKDKKETFTRLINEGKLHSLALLRNLRGMAQCGVDESVIFNALDTMKTDRVLPFRFILAARVVPQWEDKIEPVMIKCLNNHEKLNGKTILLIDVSGSMDNNLSEKSEVTRIDTASALAILLREISDCQIFTFSNKTVQIPARHGFALRDAINSSQSHSSTYLGDAVDKMNNLQYDRLIVITDEQSHDTVEKPKGKGYMINVSSEQNGVSYGAWTHLDGFSEAIIDYIIEYEKLATT